MTYHDEIFSKVRTIILEVIDVREDQINLIADLRDDLRADSLASVEIVMAIEDAFGIVIEEEKAESLRTVGDLVDAIAVLHNESVSPA